MRFFRPLHAEAWHGPMLACVIGSALCCAGSLSAQSIPLPARNTAPATPADNGPPLAPPAKNGPKPAVPVEDVRAILNVSARFVETRPADAPTASSDNERCREQVGRLVFARVTIECEGAPLRSVLRELRRALGLNMLVFETRTVGGVLESGVDGELPVDLALSDTDGLAVLEALAALAGSDVTWQVNRGTVEFGPKSVLARAEARRTEVVEVGDLALVPPDFKSCGIGALGVESYNRLDSDEVLADLVRAISTHCEPTAFEPDPERRHDATALGNRQILAGNAATPTKSRTRHNPNTNAWRNLDPAIGPVYVHGRWASLQTRDTALVIAGPDFVLRKVTGYPSPLPPREATPAVAPAGTPPVAAPPAKPK
jgi:hypothetical protein